MAGLCATQPVVLSDGRPSALLLPQSSPCGGGANGASASALHRGLCEVLRFSACEVAAAQALKTNEAATAVATATTTTTTTTPTTTPASTILVTADLTKGNMSVQWAVGAPAAAAAAASALATPALLREVSAAFCAAAEQQSSALRCAFEAPAPPPPALPPAEQPSSAHGERRQRLGHALAGISTTVELTTPTHRLTLSSGDANGCIRPVEGGALGVGRVALTLKVLDGLRTGGDGALGWAALKNAAQAVQVEALADRIASDASDAAAAAATPPARARDAPALGMVGRRSYAPSTTTTAAAAAAGGPNIIVEVTGRSPYDLTPTLAPAVTPPKAKPQALAVLDNNALVGGDVRRARRKEGFASGDAVVPEPTLESLCRAVCSPELVEHRPASCGAGAGGVVVPAPAVPIPSGGDSGGGGGAATYRSKLAQTMRYAEGLQLQLGPAATTPPPPPAPPQPAQRPPSALGGCDVPPVLSPLACMMRTACCSPASLDASGCERVGDSASVLATAADGLICGVCRDEIAFDGTVSALVYCEACRTYSCHQCVVAHVKAATRRRMLGTPSRGATPEVLSPSSLLSPKFTDGNTLRCPQFGCREVLSEEVVNTVLASYVGVFCGKCKCEVPFDGSVESIPLCEGCGKYCCEACFTTHLTDQILKSSTVSCGIDGCTHAVSQADLRKYLPTELFESVERKTDDELGAAFAGSAGGRRFKCVACKINIEKDSTGLRAELAAMRRRFEREKVAPGGTVSIDHADMTLQAALHYTEHRIRCGCCAATFCSECFATPYHAGQTCEQAAHPLRCRYCDASLLAPQVVRVPSQPAAAVLPAKPAEDNAKDAGANPPQPKPSGSAWWRRRLFSSGNQDKRGGGDGAKSAVIPVQPDASSSASAATAASGGAGAGAGAGECIVVDVCGSAECRRHFAVACKKVLPCGHNCNGVGCQEAPPALADATASKEPKDGVGTLVVPPPAKPVTRWGCLPCLKQDCCAFKKRLQEAEEKPSATATPGYVTCQSGSDFCSICWAESLSAAPCIQLPCGHIVHHHCVVEKLQNKWPTLRISFAFLACTLCGDEMRHPSSAISELLKPLLKMRADLSKKWLDRLKLEGLVSVPAITSDTASPYYKAPLKYAEHMLNYYQCSKCDKPYFGGVKRCDDLAGYDEDGNGEVREIQRSELVCGACVDKTSCPKHGTEYIQFKCRYCCRPAVWFCWGTTHFCDKCHRSLPQKLPRCSGPESCPLRLDHPPNGQEFAIGCVACRFDFPAAP